MGDRHFPASYHNRAEVFHLFDGHSEIRKWRDGEPCQSQAGTRSAVERPSETTGCSLLMKNTRRSTNLNCGMAYFTVYV